MEGDSVTATDKGETAADKGETAADPGETAADPGETAPDPHFMQRVGSLPFVTTALGQLSNIYQYGKESNRYIKYTLETAEAGLKTVTEKAMPVVSSQLERPIGAIDSLACGQLSKLQEKYPIITKPTDEVVEETKKVYEATLKPHLDTVSDVTKTSIEKVGDTLSATKQYTIDTVNSVKDFTTTKVSEAKDYTRNMVTTTASYGKAKLGVSPENAGQEDLVETAEEKEKLMQDLLKIQDRSNETLQRLNCTVDLIEYAKSSIDGAKETASSARTKFLDVWEMITREEGQIEMSNLPAEKLDDAADGAAKAGPAQGQQVTRATLERRAIATARHLTCKLKTSFSTIMCTGGDYLPALLQTQVSAARTVAENLYAAFTTARTIDDVPTTLLIQTRAHVTQLQKTLNAYTDYIHAQYFAPPTAVDNGDDETGEKGDSVPVCEEKAPESVPQAPKK